VTFGKENEKKARGRQQKQLDQKNNSEKMTTHTKGGAKNQGPGENPPLKPDRKKDGSEKKPSSRSPSGGYPTKHKTLKSLGTGEKSVPSSDKKHHGAQGGGALQEKRPGSRTKTTIRLAREWKDPKRKLNPTDILGRIREKHKERGMGLTFLSRKDVSANRLKRLKEHVF